jgi:AraC-like DNA-binding protein
MFDKTNQVPLQRLRIVETTNPTEFRDALVERFDAHGFEFRGPEKQFEATRNYIKLPSLDVVFGGCTGAYEVSFPGVGLVKQHFAVRQGGRTTFGGTQFEISPTQTAVIPAGVDMTHEYSAGFEQFIFRIDANALQSKLSAIIGMPVTRGIEFASHSDFTNPSLQRLRRLLKFMVSEFNVSDDKMSGAVLTEFEQLLVVSFLAANPHNFTELMERDQARPAPWQVRLVEEFIEANWQSPITVEALAEAAGASMRSVFKAFRESRNCSPMAFVKSVRLEQARRRLLSPEAATSVVSVALECGFLNPGHFARDYRLAFGELPSATLSRTRPRRA